MKKELNIMIILIILNICAFIYTKNNIKKINVVPTSYRCISLVSSNNIIEKIVELDDDFKITYETYYTYNRDNNIFNDNYRTSFYNLNNKNYKITRHQYAYKNKDMTISEYVEINDDYICSINSYKQKED